MSEYKRINTGLVLDPLSDYYFGDKLQFHSEFNNRLNDYNITFSEMFESYIKNKVEGDWAVKFIQISIEKALFFVDIYANDMAKFEPIKNIISSKMPKEINVLNYYFKGDINSYLKE
jgi:hypothetical protein